MIIEDRFVPGYPQFPVEFLGDRDPKETKDRLIDEGARENIGPILWKLGYGA